MRLPLSLRYSTRTTRHRSYLNAHSSHPQCHDACCCASADALLMIKRGQVGSLNSTKCGEATAASSKRCQRRTTSTARQTSRQAGLVAIIRCIRHDAYSLQYALMCQRSSFHGCEDSPTTEVIETLLRYLKAFHTYRPAT